jgi:hypothetical protein
MGRARDLDDAEPGQMSQVANKRKCRQTDPTVSPWISWSPGGVAVSRARRILVK